MPYKFNESRRHKFKKATYKIQNWAEYKGEHKIPWGISPTLGCFFHLQKFCMIISFDIYSRIPAFKVSR